MNASYRNYSIVSKSRTLFEASQELGDQPSDKLKVCLVNVHLPLATPSYAHLSTQAEVARDVAMGGVEKARPGHHDAILAEKLADNDSAGSVILSVRGCPEM